MSNHFRVGDLVILQHPTYYHEQDGYPAIITGGYAPRIGVNMYTMGMSQEWTYEVRVLKAPSCMDAANGTVLVRPHQIRKPKPLGAQHREEAADRGKETLEC